MKIKGILFDKDGTLIDFFEIWGKAAEPVVKRLIKNYLPKEENAEGKVMEKLGVKNGVIDPESALAWKPYDLIAEDLAEVLLFGNAKTAENLEKLKNDIIHEFDVEVNDNRESYETTADLKKVFPVLYDMGIKLGIATTDEYEPTVKCIEKLGISKYISFFATGGSDYPVKPDKKLMELAAKEWGIRPCEIAMVGDTPNDMRFAENAGAFGIAVLSGAGKPENMQPPADCIINSVGDLPRLIKKINGGNG